jgi:hypothetical protein
MNEPSAPHIIDAAERFQRVQRAIAEAAIEYQSPAPELLGDVEGFIRMYCALPSESAYTAMALWAAHAHAADAAESTPRLAFLSPEPASGKTRALEVIETLVPRPLLAVNCTASSLFRAVGESRQRPTVLFDEIDTVFGPRAKEHEELRSLLNAGHRRSGVAYRCVGEGRRQEVRAFPAFAPCALAGLGALPDTLLSRSIVIQMKRRAPGEPVTPFRAREAEATGHALRDRLAEWTAGIMPALAAARPVMPEGVTDRDADVWEPLLALADAAGGDWPRRAREACTDFVAARREHEPSLGVRLLADIRTVFSSEDKLATAELLNHLRALDLAPWADLRGAPLDARKLARMLGKYGIKPALIRTGNAVARGYLRADFQDAWARYLPLSADLALQALQVQQEDKFERETGPDPVTDKGPCNGSDVLQPPACVTGSEHVVTPVTHVTLPREREGDGPPGPAGDGAGPPTPVLDDLPLPEEIPLPPNWDEALP